MAEMIIQNPSITPNVFEYDEAGRVSAISGYPLAGGGGGTIVKSDLMWKPSVESDGFVHWTLASSATTPAAAYISGAQGPAGPQGVSGNPGKNPEFQINPTDAHWQWKYSGDAGWTDLGVVASGAVGPQGLSGNNGKDGISPKVRINNSTNFWEISEDNGVTWTSTNVSATGPAGEDGTDGKDGASGTNGKDGVSPTVSTSAIPGGNRVIFTYDNGGTPATESIDVMSGASGAPGADGVSPTVTITDAPTAAQHPQGGKTVTITDATHPGGQSFDIWNGINGEGATVNLLDGNGIHITNDGTNYTIAVSADYAAKSYVDSASAYALSQAESWVETEGYLKEIPAEYAKKSDIRTTVAELSDSGNYYKKTETSGATEITNALSTKLDSTAADQTYQTKSDMANYLTTSDASTTYQPKGNYASASDITDMATKTWVGQQNFITKDVNDLTYYYKKTETSGASELSTEFAKYVSTGDILTGTGNTLTGIKIGSTDYTVPTIDLSNYYTKSETSANSELDAEFANKVDKPDTTQTSLNNKYLVYSTLSGAGAVTGWTDFNANVYSKSESDGRYMQKNTDSTLSGDGTTNHPLGIDSDNFYELDTAGNYLTSQTSNQKTLIGTTPALDNAIGKVIASADVWDTVSAKSIVTVNSANNEIKINNNPNSAISATIYDVCNTSEPSLIPQRLIVGTSSGDFVTYVNGGKCNGQGTLFFWLESMQPWVPVNN